MSYVGNVTAGGTTHLVGSTLYGTCDTAANAAAKAVTCASFDRLITGVTVHVKFTNSNTAADPTLNVNGTGAKSIYRYGTTRPSTTVATSWQAGAVVSFTYDGASWVMNDNTVYAAATQSAAGLMSAADKQALDELSSKMEGGMVVIDIAAGNLSTNESVTLPYVTGATTALIECRFYYIGGEISYTGFAMVKNLKSSGNTVVSGEPIPAHLMKYSVNSTGDITISTYSNISIPAYANYVITYYR